MAKYRTAVIACGTIARVHARGWLGIPEQPTEIGAIADTHPDARREYGDFFNVAPEHRYADYREMLEKERPDFVDVCSWHAQHAEMTIAAAQYHPKAIQVQKPMALNLAQADAMLTACQRNNVKLVVAFQRPHHSTWLKARDLIKQGVIGDPIHIVLDCGGNILNTNSHNIALALFLLGNPRAEWVMGAVERTTEHMERGQPCEDRSLGLVGLANGCLLHIQGELSVRKDLGQGARVIGTEGIMELGTGRPPNAELRSDGDMYQPEGSSAKYNDEFGWVRYMNSSSSGWQNVEAPWHDAWAHMAQETIDWVDGKISDPISSGPKGRVVMEIMMALFESARRRQRIDLPLKTKLNPLALMVENGDLPVEWPGAYEVRARLVRGEKMSWHDS